MAIFQLRRKNLKRAAPGRKSTSLEANRDGTVKADGVFVSCRTLAMSPLSPPSSASSMSTSGSAASSIAPASPPTSWKSSGAKNHNLNAPLVVSSPDASEEITDEAEKLGLIIARNRQLPGTWYYSSNHVLVNQERTRRTMAPLIRMVELDQLARIHAEQMAEEVELHHIEPYALRLALKDIPYRRLGENVARGENIRDVHEDMMNTLSNKNNIIDRRFTHMGMGTAVGPKGELFLCQIFRG